MLSQYRAILSYQGALTFVCAGFAIRMAHFTTVLGIVFLVAHSTGSYGSAGVVSGAYALSYSAIAPLLSGIADRRGQTLVLYIAGPATLLTRSAFIVAGTLSAPVWALAVLSAASGASMPATGAFVRARWQRLLGTGPQLNTATSLESVLDEILLIVGPIVVAICATYVNPVAGPMLALPLAVCGLAALALQRKTAPTVTPASRQAGGTALSTPGFPALLVTFALVSGVITTADLGVVAFSQQHHAAALSGLVLAALSGSSAVGGLWYGARQWSRSPLRRLRFILPVMTAGTLPFIAVAGTGWLFVAALLLGVTIAPTLITGYSIVNLTVIPDHLTEGLTWMSTAAGLGICLGSVAGRIVDAYGTRAAFVAATCVAVAATAVGFVANRLQSTTG